MKRNIPLCRTGSLAVPATSLVLSRKSRMDHRTPEQRALAAARIAYVRAAARHYAAPSLASINAWVAACSVVLRAADRANGKDTPWTSAC